MSETEQLSVEGKRRYTVEDLRRLDAYQLVCRMRRIDNLTARRIALDLWCCNSGVHRDYAEDPEQLAILEAVHDKSVSPERGVFNDPSLWNRQRLLALSRRLDELSQVRLALLMDEDPQQLREKLSGRSPLQRFTALFNPMKQSRELAALLSANYDALTAKPTMEQETRNNLTWLQMGLPLLMLSLMVFYTPLLTPTEVFLVAIHACAIATAFAILRSRNAFPSLTNLALYISFTDEFIDNYVAGAAGKLESADEEQESLLASEVADVELTHSQQGRLESRDA